jgi:hypothetical protein
MGEEWGQGPTNNAGQPNQDEIDKRLEEIKRKVSQGANEAQERLKKAFNKASDYWQNVQVQTTPTPRQASSVEEQRIRQLVNTWSNENWRVARDLGNYMDLVSSTTDEVWELTIETRWETRNMEIVSEPYSGSSVGMPRPLLPVWDYELPSVSGLKAPQTRTRAVGLDEVVSCTNCNGTGHTLCSNCTGRGWVVCPDCKGRTRKRCGNCRGRGYVSDYTPKGEKKGFFKRRTEGVTSVLGNKVSDVFDGIRQQGVPIPNPVDNDPAKKGPTIPCPECINGEVECTCGNGKRVCSTCQGARMSLCNGCGGTGKLVRHREIVRGFDLRTQTHFLGDCPIPPQQMLKANGDLVFSAEVNETFHVDAPPDRVPMDIWRSTVELVRLEGQVQDKPGVDMQSRPRPTLQVVELARIPYTSVNYRLGDQEYVLYIYDSEGKEKFHAERYPARWDRIERLFKAISTDLLPGQEGSDETPPSSGFESGAERDPGGVRPQEPRTSGGPVNNNQRGNVYRVPVEIPPYSDDEDERTQPRKP